ncbi:hypothetical protein [Natrinema sp. 74]|uniref:hypothetical protein n=1 Tax=Natrinema sp. 74 TaxID=3384159 RepID=UPI0038D45523
MVMESSDTITWSYRASESRQGRFFLYLQIALIGGVVSLLIYLLLLATAATTDVGESQTLILFVLAILIGGPVSILYLLSSISNSGRDASFSRQFGLTSYNRLSIGWVVISSVFGAVISISSFFTHPLLILIVFVGGPVVAFGGVGLFESQGKINTKTGTFRVGSQSYAIEDINEFSVYEWDEFAFLRLSFANEIAWITTPLIIPIPADIYKKIEPVLVAAQENKTEPVNPSSSVERIILAVFGVGALIGAIGLVYMGTQEGGAVLYWLASLVGVLALVFLVMSIRDFRKMGF